MRGASCFSARPAPSPRAPPSARGRKSRTILVTGFWTLNILTRYDRCSRLSYDIGSSPAEIGRKAQMTRREYELGEAELAVLRVLWDHGPLTVRDVMDHLHERGRKVAYTTVLTFLSRLEQKGFVVSDKKELAYVYRTKVSRDSVVKSRVKSLLDQLYDGAAGPMVLQLIENGNFSADEIAQLRKLIKDLDS